MANRLWEARREALRVVLRESRLEAGLTQQQLSLALDRPQSFVSKYESGERKLDFVEVLDICASLDITPQSVIERYLSKVSG